MRPDTITIAIEEKYKPEELAEIAGKLAIAVADLETIAGEKKVSDAAFNERLKRCDGQITELAKRYNKGCETAQIGCDIKYNHPEPGKKSYVRMDTGELVESHDMSFAEKQEMLQFNLTILPADETPAEPDDLEKAMGLGHEGAAEPPPACICGPMDHPSAPGGGRDVGCPIHSPVKPPDEEAPPLEQAG